MRCTVCGADNLEGAAYCEDCGARLQMAAAQPTQEASQTAVSPIPTPIAAVPVVAPVPVTVPGPVDTPAPIVEIPPVTAPPAAFEPVAAPAVSSGSNITCPACGAHNLAGVAFCEDCGASLSDTPASSAAINPPVHYDAAPVAVVGVAAGGQSGRPRLIHTSGREFPLEKDTVLLGRRSPVDGIFPEVDLTDYDTDSYISRRHGRITRQNTGFVYEDLGSSNGSWINGSKLQAHVQQALNEGSSLRLGKTEMVVRLS